MTLRNQFNTKLDEILQAIQIKNVTLTKIQEIHDGVKIKLFDAYNNQTDDLPKVQAEWLEVQKTYEALLNDYYRQITILPSLYGDLKLLLDEMLSQGLVDVDVVDLVCNDDYLPICLGEVTPC